MRARTFLKLALSVLVVAGGIQTAFAQLLPEQETPRRWVNEQWGTDFSKAVVPFGEVGSVLGRDNIPSIDNPIFLSNAEENLIPGIEPVASVEINGDARAYPLRLLMWHEIVNDTVGGKAIAVTYCPLCNTTLVFGREFDGEAVEFGTSGKLLKSNLIMYDRTSWTWWQQFTGEGIVGARSGELLELVPSRIMSLDLFKETYPDGQVLQPDPGVRRNFGANPYVNYDETFRPFLFDGELPTDIDPMERVVIIKVKGEEQAVSLTYLSENAPVTLGKYEVRWSAGQASALGASIIAQGKDIGNVRVVENPGPNEEDAIYDISFAFAARAFLPDLEILQ
jgi:uncharacterized protein DUF3179